MAHRYLDLFFEQFKGLEEKAVKLPEGNVKQHINKIIVYLRENFPLAYLEAGNRKSVKLEKMLDEIEVLVDQIRRAVKDI